MDTEFDWQSRRFVGKQSGPRLLITAGVHGDEFLPMLAVKRLIERFESDAELSGRLRGTVTLIPIVNPPAFARGHRCGEDGMDLARTCPGHETGGTTERIAHALRREISGADYYVDLHSGGTELCVWPLAGYMLHRNKTILDAQRNMAQAFGLPLVWGTSAELQGRSLSVARDAGVPAIYVEYLGAHRELAEVASGAMRSPESDHPLVAGCLDLMRHLQMFGLAESSHTRQETIEDWRLSSGHLQICNPAPAGGFLTMKVTLGSQVSRGELLAEIVSQSGTEKRLVLSEQDGKVVVIRDYPRINQGDTVAVIVERYDVSDSDQSIPSNSKPSR